MRKVLSIFLVVLFIGSMAYAAPDPTNDRGTLEGPGAVGEIKGGGNFPSECYRTFRLVRYANCNPNEMHISPDGVVIWDTVSDDGVTITLTTTSADSRVAGVAVSHILTADTAGNTATQDIGKRNWGYIQTYGLCQVSVDVSGGFSAGEAIATGGLEAGKVTGFSTAVSSTPTNGCASMGFAMDDGAASANNVEVFLKGLE